MTASPPITITSEKLREGVERLFNCGVPDNLWRRAEPYARKKLDRARKMQPKDDYFDNDYLVLLTRDVVSECAFSDYTIAKCMKHQTKYKQEVCQ